MRGKGGKKRKKEASLRRTIVTRYAVQFSRVTGTKENQRPQGTSIRQSAIDILSCGSNEN